MKMHFARTGIIAVTLGIALLVGVGIYLAITSMTIASRTPAEFLPADSVLLYTEEPAAIKQYLQESSHSIATVITAIPAETEAVFILNSASGSSVGFVVPFTTEITPSSAIHITRNKPFTFVTTQPFVAANVSNSLFTNQQFSTLYKNRNQKANWLYSSPEIAASLLETNLPIHITDNSGLNFTTDAISIDSVQSNANTANTASHTRVQFLPGGSYVEAVAPNALQELLTHTTDTTQAMLIRARLQYLWQNVLLQANDFTSLDEFSKDYLKLEVDKSASGTLELAISGRTNGIDPEAMLKQAHEHMRNNTTLVTTSTKLLGTTEYTNIAQNTAEATTQSTIGNWTITQTSDQNFTVSTGQNNEDWFITTASLEAITNALEQASSVQLPYASLVVQSSIGQIIPVQNTGSIVQPISLTLEQMPQITRLILSRTE